MALTERPLEIASELDVVAAHQAARALALELGFAGSEPTIIATATSELARNIITYATRGEMVFSLVTDGDRRGIRIVARDQGPGIADVELALQDGFSTTGSLGLGLPGTKRLMDDLEVVSCPGGGTTVTGTKWLD